MKKTLLILAIFLMSILSLLGQDTSLDKYFDDKGLSTSKNILKLNLSSIIVGDYSLMYERLLGESFRIEIGFGVLASYYTKEFPYHFIGETPLSSNPSGGYSFSFSPRTVSDNIILGIKYRRRVYFLQTEEYIFNDYIIYGGYQLITSKKIVLEVITGIGLRFSNPKGSRRSYPLIPFGIEIGYLF